MDGSSFDRVVRALVSGGSRRRLLGLLSMVPLSGWASRLLEEPAEAAGRRKRRKKRHHHQQGDGKDNRKGKQKGKGKGKHQCTPEPATVTCAGHCGTLTNTCGSQVDCGPCACTPSCPLCQTCDAATGQCLSAPDGTVCGT